MPDLSAIERLRSDFEQQLAAAGTEQDLKALRDRFLGRKGGALSALMKELAAAPPDVRPALGRQANELKTAIEQALESRRAALETSRPVKGAVDVTLPGRAPIVGHRHPLTVLRERIETIFARQGYEILDGPETEDDHHNFEALNMPPDHPARDMQDTLYLRQPFNRPVWAAGRMEPVPSDRPATLLRTHTSAMQIRYMESHPPPVRVIAPGRVYRRDNLDLTHTPMFQQVEGLVVGERVTMAELKGTLIGCLRELFGPETPVMFRPSFFPYTEPSADVFIGCRSCGGKGCGVCKKTGWLEVLGCGMVHPAVFEAVGYDARAVTGFAFGIGIERLAMLLYGVDDIRLFYQNDLRFLEQFPA
ncbi:MAG TPA: phenylalanine--tRNA ligase subunit alpha [Vicinamibacterales bacterium]|nr:phenylalanine--tRNA ligase subunit alpha [Vicinamibacterales bacterium]